MSGQNEAGPTMKSLSLKNISVTLAVMTIGLILIIFSNSPMSFNGFDIDAAISTVGSVLVIGSIVNFYFENFAKSAFFEEIFERITDGTSLFHAGVEECFEHSSEISYRNAINAASTIVTLFTYSDAFLKKYETEIENAAKRDAKIKFIFVSKESPAMDALRKLGWQSNSIDSNYDNITAMQSKLEKYSNISFQFVNAIPRYASVIFDDEMYVIEHTSSFGRMGVPAFRLKKHGFLGQFYCKDIDRLQENGG